MDERFLREYAARCRSLAAKADESTARRLLALAERYEKLLTNAVGSASLNGLSVRTTPPPVER
jgi:hypothetical protein